MKAMRTMDGPEVLEQPRYMADLCLRNFASRWHTRAGDGDTRTPAKLDADVNITLPRQWALLQPAERVDERGCISIAASTNMNWSDALSPGLEGVRLLVVTAMQWAFNIKGDEERTQWSYLAIDMIEVLRILVLQRKLQDAVEKSAVQSGDPIPVGQRKRSAREGWVLRYRVASRPDGNMTARRALSCAGANFDERETIGPV